MVTQQLALLTSHARCITSGDQDAADSCMNLPTKSWRYHHVVEPLPTGTQYMASVRCLSSVSVSQVCPNGFAPVHSSIEKNMEIIRPTNSTRKHSRFDAYVCIENLYYNKLTFCVVITLFHISWAQSSFRHHRIQHNRETCLTSPRMVPRYVLRPKESIATHAPRDR